MTPINIWIRRIVLVGLLLWEFFPSSSLPIQSQPLALPSSDRSGLSLSFIPPPPPSVGTPTGRRRGGASRGSCHEYEDLTAIVPTAGERVWGLTTTERPSFWFLIPKPLTADSPVEFVLQDEADNYVYKTTFTMPNTGSKTQSGVIGLSIPPEAAALERGKLYHWSFLIYCDRDKPSAAIFVQGSVQRVSLAPALQRQLEEALPRQQIALYAANGIWYDALTHLAELRQIHPEDASLIADWKSLLQSVGFEKITQSPIVRCCKPSN